MKLDIDLNKLDLKELKLVVALAEKQEMPKIESTKELEVAFTEPKKRFAKFSRKTWSKDEISELKSILATTGNTKKQRAKLIKRFAKENKRTLSSVWNYTKRHLKNIKPLINKRVAIRYTENQLSELKEICNKANNKLANATKGIKEFAVKLGKSYNGVKSYAYYKKYLVPESNEEIPRFPEFEMVAEAYRPILQDMLVNIAKIPNIAMTIRSEGKILDLPQNKWIDLCAAISINANKIAKYFNIPNKYKISNDFWDLPMVKYE